MIYPRHGVPLSRTISLLLVFSVSFTAAHAADILVPSGAVWKYLDNGSNQGTAWRQPGFSDSGWLSGPAQLGYGDGDEATVVSYGPNSSSKYVTTYFRRAFSAIDAAGYDGVTLRLLRDDGAVVYLNGTEVFRSNMPGGTISYSTFASSAIGGADENTFYQTAVNPVLLVEGVNVIAVEVHQANATSSDLSFNLELTATRPPISLALNSPPHGAVGVPNPPTLQATPTDPEGQPLTVTFYGRSAGLPPGPDFSLIALPDTQYYVSSLNGGRPETFTAQTDWIVANKQAMNIAFVTQLGDCVENGDNVETEWWNATNAMYRLENPLTTLLPDGLPYGIAVGNHEQTPLGNADGTTIFYNQYFGQAHFAGRDYYGGHHGANNDNHFELFSASGLDFIVVHLEYDTTPDQTVLTWANSLLQTHSQRRAIVVSHHIIGTGNPAAFGTQGQAIYDALKGNANLFLLLSGHVLGEGRRTDVFNGNTVQTVMSDYQGRANGGDGWLRIMEFSPGNNLIRIKTFSPTLNRFETDADSQFTLGYDMQLPGPPYTAIQTNTGVASGSGVTTLWNGLAPSSEYEWYATASDGVNSATSPIWRFTTAANSPPSVSITQPGNYAVFAEPADIPIEAEASDVEGSVARVEFFEGNSLLGEDTSSPYALVWNAASAGSYILTAVAHDDTGLISTSAVVNVTVTSPGATNAPPTAGIDSPAEGAAFLASANIVINATANDSDGSIAKVEFFQGTTKLGEDASSPYSFNWNFVPAGNYSITAVAQDNLGASGISTPVNITVTNAPEIAVVTRGPYLQMGTPASMIVRWRTDVATGTRLRYGTDPANLDQLISDPTQTTEHIVQVTGLNADTLYYYEMGTATGWFTADANDFFITSPPHGSPKSTRIWVLGDSGTADANAANVRNGYLQANAGGQTEVWLMLGDNAYNNGTDAEHQAAVFNMYPTVLQNTVLWPTLGNHDTAGSANPSPTLPYFQIFSLPTGGEAGGIASGTEKYYSFDYANVHFICLDSMSSDRGAGGPMATWLQSDLQNTTQEWLIAFWHHPPYSKGSHNSDTETELVQMRQNFLPLLESQGVDLVLSGHSHSYERSFLLNGHYGTSGTFAQSMKKDGGSGREDGTGAYTKPAGAPNEGAVYSVAGSSGKISGGSLNHPGMFISLNQLGSMVLDVNTNRLDAYFLGTNGLALDYFTLIKSNTAPSIPAAPAALVASTISSTEISLSWVDNAPDEDGFKIERSTDGLNFAHLAEVGANVTGGLDNGLAAGTSYWYRVRAFNAAGDSDYSNVASALTDPPSPPAAPTGLTAVPHDARVDLTWNASSGADSYNVKRATVSGGPYTVTASGVTGLSYSDTGLVNGTEYFYAVSSVGAAGEGPDSAEVSARPQSPPAAPGDLSATPVAYDRIDLSWTDQADNETGFRIERSVDDVDFVQVAEVETNVTAYADTGLIPATAYWYRVRAFNSSGDSAPVEVGTSTPLPPAPANLAATPEDAQISLGWSPVGGASGYNVKRATVSGGPYIQIASGVTVTSFNDATVDNGTAYFYVVSAVVLGVQSADSAEAGATPQAPPDPPTALSGFAVSTSEVSLAWSDNSTDEDGFKIERSLDGVNYILIAQVAPEVAAYSDTGLAPDTTYFYQVRAFNTAGDSAAAMTSATTLPLPPAAPTGLTALGGNDVVRLSWTESDGATSYQVYRSTISGGPYNQTAYGVGNTMHDDSGVIDGTQYFYVVTAVNNGGESPPSSEASAVAGGPPAAPANLIASAVWMDEIDLAWQDNADDELGFKIERSLDGVNYVPRELLGPNATGYFDSGLAAGTTYYYRLRAYNSFGDSEAAEASATTFHAPTTAPTALTATAVSSNRIDLAWTDNATNETGFSVERSPDATTWVEIATVAANVAALADSDLLAGITYYYRVRAFNPAGYSAYANEASATTPLPPIDDLAIAETTTAGTRSGSYNNTWAKDGSLEVITEVESGGKPATRHSLIEHTWTFEVSGGNSVTFFASVWTTATTDGDSFVFAHSPDGANFTTMFAVAATEDDGSYRSFALPAATQGTVYVRATDTDRTAGARSLDSLYVDHLFIRSQPGPQLPPPSAPTDLSATAISGSQIDLVWTDNALDEDGSRIERSSDGINFSQIATVGADIAVFSDTTVEGGMTYYYRLRAFSAAGGNSDYSNVASATTPLTPPAAPSGLVATAASKSQINLAWADNSATEAGFRIERSTDGNSFSEVATVGAQVAAYADSGLASNRTYYYRLRAFNSAGISAYSNVASAKTPKR